MSPHIRYTILIVFLAIVKLATPLKVYLLEDMLAKKPLGQETSIHLKPDISRDNLAKRYFCNKKGIICFTARQEEVKDVLREGEDVTIKYDRSSNSEEHSLSNSDENQPAYFDDLTRGSQKRVKRVKHRRFQQLVQLKPVAFEDNDIKGGKLGEDRRYFTVSGRRLGKIIRKQPKVMDFDENQENYLNQENEESESDDEEEDDDKEPQSIKSPPPETHIEENEEETSDSEETGKGGDDKDADASPETEEQVENIKKKPLEEYKQFMKPDEPVKKRKKHTKISKKYRIPKRFEVVDNGDEDGAKSSINRGDEAEESEEKSNESSINPAPDSNLDLTVLEEKNSIEKPTENPDPVDMRDNKEKYTYIQGLDRTLHVGKKKEESSEEQPLAEDDKTTEEDAALLYRRGYGRLPYFLPKRYFWSEEDYRNLGYFWFNGPQGKSPGSYRIRYK